MGAWCSGGSDQSRVVSADVVGEGAEAFLAMRRLMTLVRAAGDVVEHEVIQGSVEGLGDAGEDVEAGGDPLARSRTR